MNYRLQSHLKIIALILLTFLLLVARGAEQNQAREEIDLSGWWKVDYIRPGQGVKENYHNLPTTGTSGTRCWMIGKVPGDAYTDLWRAGVIDDPYYGRNIVKTKWVIEYEWWYVKRFIIPERWKGKVIQVIFEGVDYECQVWLNGEYLGSHEGMFSKFVFDVSDKIFYGGGWSKQNVLTVKIEPPPRDRGRVGGRKAKTCYEGDYLPHFIMLGIWRPVKVRATGQVSIKDVYVEPEVKDDGSAVLNIQAELQNHTDARIEVIVNAKVNGKNFSSKTYTASVTGKTKPGGQIVQMKLTVDDSKLWWPWDMGEQNLYRAEVTIVGNGKFYDRTETTFGIKDLKMEMNPGFTKDEVAYPWTFMINGKRHFLRGACWSGPPDLMHGRNTVKRYKEFIKLAKEANINHLRIFGWHPPEIPEFYDLCDEAGITVWQEFAFAKYNYPDNDDFRAAAYEECIEIVKDRRNHPCLVLWCGGEELFATEGNKKLLYGIGDAIKPYTSLPYVPMSAMSTHGGPEMGFKPKEDRHACSHWYSVGFGHESLEKYYANTDYAMISEICEASAPCVESIKKFIPPDELWPPGPSWGYHFANLGILQSHNLEVLGDERTGSLEEFVNATQIAEGSALQYAIETFRRKKPHISGSILCHFIDPWPDFNWAIVDYYVKPKISYYMTQTAFQPVLPSLEYSKRRWNNGEIFNASLWVVNDYHRPFKNCTIEMHIKDKKGKILKEDSVKVDVEPDSSKKLKSVKWKVPEDLREGFNVELSLKDSKGVCISSNVYEHSFLIGDQEKEWKIILQKATEVRKRKQNFDQWWNYYWIYPDLAKEQDKQLREGIDTEIDTESEGY